MSPIRRAWLALLLAAVVLSLSAPLAAAPIRVTGRVQSEKAGLSGARLELFPAYEGYAEAVRRLTEKTGPAPLVKARTDAEGDFEILVPESGCYRLEVRAEGYLAEEFPLVPLVEDFELPPTTLMRGSPVEVRAVGPDGRPLAGIEVRSLYASPWSWRIREGQFRTWSLIPPRATTDREGRASLSWYKPYGPPAVEAVSPRFLGQKATGEPAEAVTLRLSPARAVWIEARDAGGQPVPGALARWNGQPVGITGPDGRLEIAVPDGESALTLETRDGWGARVVRTEGKGLLPVRLSPPRRIAGRVVDSLGRKPVAGAVAWSGFPLVAPPVRTDAEGTFSLDVPVDEGWLEAGAAGFLPGERQLAKKGAQATVLTLAPSATLSGTVVDKSGRPVEGVRITLGYMKGTQGLQVVALSHEDGRFRFPQLPPGGTFDLTAVRTGFARTQATARTAPAGQPSPPARIVMEDGQTAFGRVVDPGGRPIPGAAVKLRTEGQSSADAVSDAEGRFEFRHLSPGRISVLASHPDHAPAFLNQFEIPSGNPRVDLGTLRLPPGEFIEGRVTNSRGTPIEGAAVWVHPGEGRNLSMFWASEDPEPLRTAPDGTFRAGNLEGGQRFHVRVEHSGYVEASLPGVEAPTQEPLQIELKAARSLSGRVTGPEGEPVADASLNWFQSEGGGGYSSRSLGTSDADGRFQVTGFPPGPLSLVVSAEGYVPRQIEGLQIPGDREPEELQITLQRAITLEVRVLNAEGEPVPDARVFAQPVAQGMRVEEDRLPPFFLSPHFARQGSDRTDVAGRCRLTVPKPGSYWVSASRQGPAVRTQVTARPGSNAVEIRLPAGAEVSGRVVDENGAAIPRAHVRLQQSQELQQRTWSGADGAFVFAEMPDGEYRLTAILEGLASEELAVTVAGRPVRGLELRLDRQRSGATLSGHILGLSPEEVSGLRVEAFRTGEFPLSTRANREGAYRFEKLSQGEWRIQTHTFDGRSAQETVEIPPGVPTMELNLEFQAGLTLTGRVLVDGVPLSEAGIAVHSKETFRSGTQTAYDGTFRLRNVSSGPVTLVISGPQGLGGVRKLTLTESQEIKIELTTGRLTGAVVLATGEPVEDALVRLQAWLPDHQFLFGESVARTGPDGTFEVPRLGTGTYKIKISKGGFAPAEATAEVRAGGSSAPVAIVLKPQQEENPQEKE
jgi:protocatechuate 3,4-dioxygenase beta subunit